MILDAEVVAETLSISQTFQGVPTKLFLPPFVITLGYRIGSKFYAQVMWVVGQVTDQLFKRHINPKDSDSTCQKVGSRFEYVLRLLAYLRNRTCRCCWDRLSFGNTGVRL